VASKQEYIKQLETQLADEVDKVLEEEVTEEVDELMKENGVTK
jgi:predicted house-cleaning noncanonical NTP pyrophosphatase (MazG superfamily)